MTPLLLACAALAQGMLEPGRYALEVRVASAVKVPLIGEFPGGSRSLVLVDVTRDELGLSQRHRVCDVRLESPLAGASFEVPRAFVQSLPPRQVRPQVGPLGEYRADLGDESVGLATGLHRIPQDAGSSGFADSDADGLPGATLWLNIPVAGRVRLQVAQTARVELVGAVDPGGVASGGLVIHRFEQRTIGADPGVFSRQPQVHPRPEGSSFMMVPIPEDADCRQVVCALAECA